MSSQIPAGTEPVKIKPPKTLGACIDLLYTWEQERAVIERQVGELKKRETALEQHIFEKFSKDELNGSSGKLAKASIIRSDVPQLEAEGVGWSKIWPYIIKKKAYDLLQKRLSTTAVRERWNVGEVIPGVTKYTAVSLSVTKLK